jgi:plasmid stability protein
MASLTVKGIPDDLLKGMRERARAHRRSLNSEAIVAFERALGPTRFDPQEMLARVRALHEQIGSVTPMTPEEMEEAINEGRP